MTARSSYQMPDFGLKGRFPFRLGCTSFVYPDDYVANAAALAESVDDIELLAFECDGSPSLFNPKTLRELDAIRQSSGITYTIHLPLDICPVSAAGSKRERYRRRVVEMIEHSALLNPYAFILHLYNGAGECRLQYSTWLGRVRELCRNVAAAVPGHEHRISIENVAYPYEWNRQPVEEFGFSYCCDIGHLWSRGEAFEGFAERFLDRTRVVHLHGVVSGRDHRSLESMPDKQSISIVLDRLTDVFRGVVTLEVFREEYTIGSLNQVRKYWEKSHW